MSGFDYFFWVLFERFDVHSDGVSPADVGVVLI
jgi:hypothetical protein